jgi:uncharacterized membrane protein
MKALKKLLRDTLVGGVVFLLPFLLVGLLLEQALDMSQRLMSPVTRSMALTRELGAIAHAIVSIVGLLLLALLAGIFVRTRPGQRLFIWMEQSVFGALPQFESARRIVESIGDDDGLVRVVLVPSDGGLALGFAFEEEVDGWLPIFLPGAPDWRSGNILFVRKADVTWPAVSPERVTRLLSKLGSDDGQLLAELRTLTLGPDSPARPRTP